jgi:flagellar assembly protein FliH
MNTLSRLLKDPAVDAKPVALRRGMGTAKSVPLRKGLPGVHGETADLRAQIAELQQSAEQQARQAYDEGLRAGDAAARQVLQADVRAMLEKLAAAVAEIAGVRSDTIHRAEADTVRLTLAIARRVLHHEVSVNPATLTELIKAALEKLQSQEVYRVRVHPDQEQVMKKCLEEAGRGQTVTVVPDPTQTGGGAVFETSRGLLDASLDTQLDEIERTLTDQLEARS